MPGDKGFFFRHILPWMMVGVLALALIAIVGLR